MGKQITGFSILGRSGIIEQSLLYFSKCVQLFKKVISKNSLTVYAEIPCMVQQGCWVRGTPENWPIWYHWENLVIDHKVVQCVVVGVLARYHKEMPTARLTASSMRKRAKTTVACGIFNLCLRGSRAICMTYRETMYPALQETIGRRKPDAIRQKCAAVLPVFLPHYTTSTSTVREYGTNWSGTASSRPQPTWF